MTCILNMDPSDQETLSLPVEGSDKSGEGQEVDEEDGSEDKYELFRNMYPKTVQADYFALMEADQREGWDVNRNNNNGEQIYGQEIDVHKGEFESIILSIAWFNSWIMIFIWSVDSDKSLSGQRQKIYLGTLQILFPIDMGQLAEEVYNSWSSGSRKT